MGFRNAPVSRKLKTAPSGPRVEISSGANAQMVQWFTGDPSEHLPAQAYVAVDGTRHTGLLFLRPPSLRPNELPATALTLEGSSSDGALPGGWTLGGPGTVTNPISGPDADWTALPLNSPTWAPYDTGANLPNLRKTAAGNVQLEGIAVLPSSTFAPGVPSQVGSLPAAYVPTRTSHRQCPIFNAAGTWIGTGLLSINAAGAVTVINGTGGTLPAGSGFGIGATFYRGA